MVRNNGRAYVFVRWSGSPTAPTHLGDVAWAFEYNDRLGRFYCFYYGRSSGPSKCYSLPEMIGAMSTQAPGALGFDEVKVFEMENGDGEAALQVALQRASRSEDASGGGDPLEETREILTRYGVRNLASVRGFSAPFLWYNILPGRSVPIRKLAVHLFQMRISAEKKLATLTEIEDQARLIASSDPAVLHIAECFATRAGPACLLGMKLSVLPTIDISAAHLITERIEYTVRDQNPHIRYVFLQVEPHQGE